MFIWFCIILFCVFADQITKWLAFIFLQGNDSVEIIPWFIRLSYLEGGNTGMAFGLLSEHRWVFMTFSTIAIVAIIVFMVIARPKDKLLCTALTLICAGGIGNMIDRIFLGYVIDFLEFTFIDFPIFNGADSFVSIGAVLLVLYLIISMFKEYKNERNARSE